MPVKYACPNAFPAKRQGDDEGVFTCQTCNQHSCISCDTHWHEGRTCQKYQRDGRLHDEPTARDIELAQEKESSEALIEKLTRKCPGLGCGAQIMKDEQSNDCDKMKCKLLTTPDASRCGQQTSIEMLIPTTHQVPAAGRSSAGGVAPPTQA